MNKVKGIKVTKGMRFGTLKNYIIRRSGELP